MGPDANSDANPLDIAHAVARQLSLAWERLSGETRTFHFTGGSVESPAHAPFSFVIPMTLDRDGSAFAVAILIEAADALTVASAMFGVAAQEVSEEDLKDACSEVCNIFADCLSTHRYKTERVHIGLPFRLNETNYQYVYDASGDRELFQSHCAGHALSVMLFTPAKSG